MTDLQQIYIKEVWQVKGNTYQQIIYNKLSILNYVIFATKPHKETLKETPKETKKDNQHKVTKIIKFCLVVFFLSFLILEHKRRKVRSIIWNYSKKIYLTPRQPTSSSK